MEPCVSFPLPDDVLEDLADKARDWAIMHGAGMRSKTNFSRDAMLFAPFLLLPSTFPRREFEKALGIQPIINELIHKVAHDYNFLKTALMNTIQVDDFTRRLFDIYETVREEGISQPISLGMIRSDIMLDTAVDGKQCSCCTQNCCKAEECQPYCCWKQVEVNTIAAGFGWMGPISGEIHRYTLAELGHKDKLSNLPPNNALQGLVSGMLDSWKIYGKTDSVIMFLIEDVSYNICDQRFHEFEIRKQNPNVFVIRKTLTDIGKRGHLNKDKELVIDGKEVAVVYFRAAYTPDHYHSQLEWDARLMIERSRAIKSPSIHYHLAGTKKVQQELSKPGMLERFLEDPWKIEVLQEIFTGLYSLDFDEYGERAMEAALEDPTSYVLKPQREGGGNNIYGEEVREALLKMKNSKERTAWILMDRINPPKQKGYMVRPQVGIIYTDVISELGIFGIAIGDENTILKNEEVGHMFRTKISTANEGGVASGLGALDSVYLVDVRPSCSGAHCCH